MECQSMFKYSQQFFQEIPVSCCVMWSYPNSHCFHYGWKPAVCKETKHGRRPRQRNKTWLKARAIGLVLKPSYLCLSTAMNLGSNTPRCMPLALKTLREPEEVQYLMDLMIEKIDEMLRDGGIVYQYEMRLYFIGNLKLISEDVRATAEKAMKATAHHCRAVLLICVAYTSSDEIVHAVQESCEEKMKNIQAENTIEAGRDSTKQNEGCEKMNGVYPPEIQDCHKREVHETVILGGNEICCSGFSKLEASEKKNGVIKRADPGFRGEKWNEVQESMQSQFSKGTFESSEDGETVREIEPLLNEVDIEQHMYMAVAPEPHIVIRSSGETRLSNFLLWQTGYSGLYSPAALWPEIGLWQLVGVVLHYQQNYSYVQKKRKQS